MDNHGLPLNLSMICSEIELPSPGTCFVAYQSKLPKCDKMSVTSEVHGFAEQILLVNHLEILAQHEQVDKMVSVL